MHLAWLYLLHAVFTRDGVDYRYRRRDNPRRFERVDGEPKRWELGGSVEHRWPNRNDPTRANIEFFIALRNKIEHRYTTTADRALTLALGGLAQALLVNYEQERVAQFGVAASLAGQLRFPVFLGAFTPEGEATLRTLSARLPRALSSFIAQYHRGLPTEVTNDQRFEMRLRVVQELVPRDPKALAIQFTRYDDMNDEDRAAVERLGRKGMVVIREQRRPVTNLELLKAREAIARVAAAVPFVFNQHHFVLAYQALRVRPPRGDAHPERTTEQYCVFDELHKDYGYTPAYVNKLIRELGDADRWRTLLGRDPESKSASLDPAS